MDGVFNESSVQINARNGQNKSSDTSSTVQGALYMHNRLISKFDN